MSATSKRERVGILQLIIRRINSGEKLVSLQSDDLPRDYREYSRDLNKLGKSSMIGISTEPEKGFLWFRRRKEKG